MVTKVTIARAVYTLETSAPARRLPAAALVLTIFVIAVGLAAFRMRG